MNYYEKIIQEKKNSKYHYKVIDEGYLGILKDEEQHKWTVQSWYGTNLLDEQRVIGPKSKAESAGERNIHSFEQRHKTNSKDKGYYQSIIEKKNADPEESMRKLQALKPIVEAFKRKGMTKHEVAMRLMQERDITETLAQQCVDTWY